MAPRRFKELQCWQLADKLRGEIAAICATPAAAADFKFCSSFQDAAGSVCRNISEGFDRFTSADIVTFFRYARASLAEVQDHLHECLARKFVSREEFDRLLDQAEHTRATVIRFMKPHQERLEREKERRRAGREHRSPARRRSTRGT